MTSEWSNLLHKRLNHPDFCHHNVTGHPSTITNNTRIVGIPLGVSGKEGKATAQVKQSQDSCSPLVLLKQAYSNSSSSNELSTRMQNFSGSLRPPTNLCLRSFIKAKSAQVPSCLGISRPEYKWSLWEAALYFQRCISMAPTFKSIPNLLRSIIGFATAVNS